MYRLELEKLGRWAEEKKVTRVLLQAPLGLRTLIPQVSDYLRSLGVDVVVSAGNCWGACDVAYAEASAVKADGIIHMGHAPMLRSEKIPTFYMECRYTDSERLIRMVDGIVEKVDGRNAAGVGMTVQWLDFLDDLVQQLKRRGLIPLIGEPGARTRYPGHIIGCDYSCLWSLEEQAESFIVVGSTFHGVGAALTSKKPVYAVDPELGRVTPLEGLVRKVLNARYAWLEVFKKSRKVGIIVGVKPGQRRIAAALKLRKILGETGKGAELVSADELSVSALTSLPYDAYVNTACPRLSIDDQTRFPTPLLLPSEALVAVGKLRWEKIIGAPHYLRMEVR